MTPEMLEHWGRTARACDGFRWPPGMRDTYRDRTLVLDRPPNEWEFPPDFSDPATLGCLEALLVEGYRGAIVLTKGNGWWSIETDREGGYWDNDDTGSYIEGCVLALKELDR